MGNRKVVKFVKFNGEKLFEDLNERGYKTGDVSERIGFHNSYLSKRKMQGTIDETILKLVCDLYKLNMDSYVVVEKKEEPTKKPEEEQKIRNMFYLQLDPKFQEDLLNRLDKLITTLAYREYEKRMVTDEEDAILLLNHMLRHGSCEERVYKAKIKDAGIDDKFINVAINKVGCTRQVLNNKIWLQAPKKSK